MKKVLLTLTAMTISLTSHAQSYLCIGADEGAVTVNTNVDVTKAVPVVAHLNGAEVRMYEMNGILSFSLKKSASDITVIETSAGSKGFEFTEGSLIFNCVDKTL